MNPMEEGRKMLRSNRRDTSRRASGTRQAPQPAPLLVLRLRGSQEQMGEQHGRLLRPYDGYRQNLEYYSELAERILLGGAFFGPAGRVARRLTRPIKHALLARLDRARPPALLARTQAFVAALGLPRRVASLYGVMDVTQNIIGLAGRLQLGPMHNPFAAAMVPACSTLMLWDGASQGGALRHARNFDFPGIGRWDPYPVVVLCEPDQGVRYGFVTSQGVDGPGVTGFNEAGLTVTAHTRFHRDVTFDGATVIDLGHEILCRAERLADAVRIARERPAASTWGLAVSSARERSAVVLETTGKLLRVVEARGDFLTCANRNRHPETQVGEVRASIAWAVHSDSRERRLGDFVEQWRGQGGMGVEQLQAALADHVDPDAPGQVRGAGGTPGQSFTVKSIIAEPEARAIWVGVGPAPTSAGPYQRVEWSWDGEPGVVSPNEPREVAERLAPVQWGSPEALQAHRHFTHAWRLEEQTHDAAAVLAELVYAIELQPDDPSYRFVAGILELRRGAPNRALLHFEHGVEHEGSAFRQGQLLLWAARAADASAAPRRAAELRAKLCAITDRRVDEYRSIAARDARRPYTRARGRRVALNLPVTDAQ